MGEETMATNFGNWKANRLVHDLADTRKLNSKVALRMADIKTQNPQKAILSMPGSKGYSKNKID